MNIRERIKQLVSRRSIPLAWLSLKRQPFRFAIGVTGIVFASTLVLMQLGFRAALFESSTALIKKFNADLVLVNKLSVSSTGLISFDRHRLTQLESLYDIEITIPVRWDYVLWKYKDLSENRLAIMMGINPSIATILQPDIISKQLVLKNPNRILYDQLSRREFGPVYDEIQKGKNVIAFLNGNRVWIEGAIRVGTSFGYDSFLLSSIETFESISNKKPGDIELGFIRLRKDCSHDLVINAIRSRIGSDLVIMTLPEYSEFEKHYWDKSKPIGFVFAFGTVMGLLVGLILIYQVLQSDITLHLNDYATMLSLGFTIGTLKRLVAAQSIIIGSIAHPLAIFISMMLYSFVRSSTSLSMFMTLERALGTFVLIFAMCSSSALLAMLKLKDANPSDILT